MPNCYAFSVPDEPNVLKPLILLIRMKVVVGDGFEPSKA